MVAVELLPSQEWKGRIVALCENETEDKAPVDTTGDPMPTGKVDRMIQYFIKTTSPFWSDLYCSLYFIVPSLHLMSVLRSELKVQDKFSSYQKILFNFGLC